MEDGGELGTREPRHGTSRIVEVIISDTGVGIDEKDMALLFKPFSQIHAGPRKSHEGTGLGLHLSQNLAHLLGGEISVKSDPGKGSMFTLRLPLAPGA